MSNSNKNQQDWERGLTLDQEQKLRKENLPERLQAIREPNSFNVFKTIQIKLDLEVDVCTSIDKALNEMWFKYGSLFGMYSLFYEDKNGFLFIILKKYV